MTSIDVVRLERARLADAGAIATLSRREIEQGLQPAWVAERVVRRIRDPESIVLVARGQAAGTNANRGAFGMLLGFAIMRFGDDRAHLDLLAVTPTWRRRGLGLRLLRWLEESALTAGTFTVSLELREDNPAARAFYSKAGYAEAGRVPRYYDGRLDAIRMQRDLRVR
jgi:ribosomal-protein-alanine N-acetyltransferase